jgi:hypothetical protein
VSIPVEPATILDAENFAAIGAFICSLAGQNYSEPLKAFALFDQKHIGLAKWTHTTPLGLYGSCLKIG